MPDTHDRIAGETRALIMDAKDNVAVAIRELTAGETLRIAVPDGTDARRHHRRTDPVRP